MWLLQFLSRSNSGSRWSSNRNSGARMVIAMKNLSRVELFHCTAASERKTLLFPRAQFLHGSKSRQYYLRYTIDPAWRTENNPWKKVVKKFIFWGGFFFLMDDVAFKKDGLSSFHLWHCLKCFDRLTCTSVFSIYGKTTSSEIDWDYPGYFFGFKCI